MTTIINSNKYAPWSLDVNIKSWACLTADNILKKIIPFKKINHNNKICNINCANCYSIHLTKIMTRLVQKMPISFVLPAFPGKSPNLNKVLGTLPDMAERASLIFLNNICESIKKIYSPGAQIIICSDGRVFSDIIGMDEYDVTNYQQELGNIINTLKLGNLSLFNLDEIYKNTSFSEMRKSLLDAFGIPVDLLKKQIFQGKSRVSSKEAQEANRMYCGITKFLFEDSLSPGQTKSKTQIQNDAKRRSYDVIRRSNAWSNLIAQRFPEHVRLSIHPQTCGDLKFGINILGNNLITPWHGVALIYDNNITIVKRHEAEKLGAKLMYGIDGRPDYFTL